MKKLLRFLALAILWCALLLATLWAAAALYFDFRVASLAVPLAVVYLVLMLGGAILIKRRWLARSAVAAGFAIVLAWWLTLAPSNERDWQPDHAKLAHAKINGNLVTLHNIRNCDYRTETDFDVRYYDKTFDLDKLRTADLYMVYWGSPHMAHTMMTFGFEGGEHICFSIETRKEKGESYSAVGGFFRQYELIYIVGDERDLVRLRTNYRKGEDAYLYRLRITPEKAREQFLIYVNRANELAAEPEWYNAIAHNCTTAIRNQRAATDRAPWDWRMVVNGYGNELLHEHGAIANDLPAEEIKARCHINERAKAADQAEDFSLRIRAGLPGMEP